MVARTLEARLSARLLALAFVVLAAVGIAAAVVTDRALADGDEARARAEAVGARESLAVELSEGDSHADAAREVIASSEGEGVRLTVWFADGSRHTAGSPDLPRLAPGACTTADDATGNPWRACATGDAEVTIVAAVPIVGHLAAVATVWRAMAALVAIATLLLWWAIRRALSSRRWSAGRPASGAVRT